MVNDQKYKFVCKKICVYYTQMKIKIELKNGLNDFVSQI